MNVLAVETSCDETSVAIYGDEGLFAHEIYSQIALHADYGGVIPELAARDHQQKLLPLVQQTLRKAKLTLVDIDAYAYTKGPGLLGALMVGASFTHALAYAEQKPCLGIHHLEAHILASFIEEPQPKLPFLALLVSGGHTLLVHIKGFGEYVILGESIDDAVGEAFDKTAKLLGLGYPGGAALAKLAQHGRPNQFRFPRPLTDRPGLNFSFSGLKTAARNALASQTELTNQIKADIAYAFEDAIIATLVLKCERAIQQTGLTQLVIAGGVAANQKLRAKLQQLPIEIVAPKPIFCTDNAAMVAITGYLRLRAGQQEDLAIQTIARESLTTLQAFTIR